MKLDAIFDNARPEMRSISAALNEGQYRAAALLSTMPLNFSISVFSDGKI
jgi:hypothetical protein